MNKNGWSEHPDLVSDVGRNIISFLPLVMRLAVDFFVDAFYKFEDFPSFFTILIFFLMNEDLICQMLFVYQLIRLYNFSLLTYSYGRLHYGILLFYMHYWIWFAKTLWSFFFASKLIEDIGMEFPFYVYVSGFIRVILTS